MSLPNPFDATFWVTLTPAPLPALDPIKLNVWMYACVMLAADAGLIEMPLVPNDQLRDTLQAYFEAQIDAITTVEALFGVRH